MMKNTLKGYTLIEMVVVAGLVGVLSIGIVSVFMSTIQGGKRAKMQAVTKVQGDHAMASMERTIRNAMKTPICSDDGKSVTFQIPNSDGTANTVVYSFDTSAGTLKSKFGAAAEAVMIGGNTTTEKVTVQPDSSFTCNLGNDFTLGAVTIKMTLRVVGDVATETEQTFQTTATLRTMP